MYLALTNKAGFILFDFINARIYACMRHAGQRRGPILRRADALWIISMNIRAYTRANYHGVYIRSLSVTLANVFDWMRYQRRLESSARLNSSAYVRAHTRVYARIIVRWEYERFSVCARIRAHTRARSMNPALSVAQNVSMSPKRRR